MNTNMTSSLLSQLLVKMKFSFLRSTSQKAIAVHIQFNLLSPLFIERNVNGRRDFKEKAKLKGVPMKLIFYIFRGMTIQFSRNKRQRMRSVYLRKRHLYRKKGEVMNVYSL